MDKIKNKDMQKVFKDYLSLSKKEEKLKSKNMGKLTPKEIKDLDTKESKLNKKISNKYVKLRTYLIDEGMTRKQAHNYLMKYK